jgi:hypothetical protein
VKDLNMPAAEDYAWFFDAADRTIRGLAAAYCLTYVRSVTPEELLRRADVQRIFEYPGLGDLFDPSYEAWEREGDGGLLLAAVPLTGWALGVEVNGYLGISAEVAGRMSRGTELVAHYYSGGNGVSQFLHAVDGEVRVQFEPLFPASRSGSAPDSLLGPMTEVGFDVGDPAPGEPDGRRPPRHGVRARGARVRSPCHRTGAAADAVPGRLGGHPRPVTSPSVTSARDTSAGRVAGHITCNDGRSSGRSSLRIRCNTHASTPTGGR